MNFFWLLLPVAVASLGTTNTTSSTQGKEEASVTPYSENGETTTEESSSQVYESSSAMKQPKKMGNKYVRYLTRYVPTVILIAGVIGNSLSFTVFSRPVYIHSLTAFMFRTLAITDTISITILSFPDIINNYFNGNVLKSSILCKVSLFSLNCENINC